MLTIEDRTLVKRGSKPGSLSTMHLEEVRDYLGKLQEKQHPMDAERSLNQLHVSFLGQRMTARFLSRRHRERQSWSAARCQHRAAGSASRFFAGLRALVAWTNRRELATVTLAKFASQQESALVRPSTSRRQPHSSMIRSVHPGLGAYSNLEFVQDLLDNATS